MFSMHYLPNSHPEVKKEMLKEIGIGSIEELFSDVPKELIRKDIEGLPKDPMPEQEVFKVVRLILKKNRPITSFPCFLGGGVWVHYVPSAVKAIISRSEFLTSYTPYQPEVSQGILQALFEYQSLMAELLDMDVVNASMYDWASALGEAALMAMRITKRRKILVPRLAGWERKLVLKTYVSPHEAVIEEVSFNMETGQISLEDLESKVGEEAAAVYLENPNFLGVIEEHVDEISDLVHKKGALLIVGVEPISLGLIRPPGSYGADVVIGEGQPLGLPPSFGGPLLGIFACRDDLTLIRQMPGRIVGLTTTKDGSKRGFVLALTTREQHIRREKATSNICTNETLCAVALAVYLSLLGRTGLRKLCESIVYNTYYVIKKLQKIGGVKVPIFKAFHFKDFAIKFERSADEVLKALQHRGVQGGIPLKRYYPELGESALFSVTEVHSLEDLNALINAIKEVVE
ncbi:MAG: aminomethyl-transferring glycine dehydrogenase subunit GcvPA [Candidatus Methanomethylicota archaeon]|uniref:Probable glycine dehydrogenase (decarboxylating) subunit 1 n=1 Tax=Thermoproteota archaeon TaxID=2056631 RepID=A0A497EQQ9_9CREN|nr:MAG: aminomethyl-transferring glycine dehydrogenase subunit GcvPA [Candidatus Verstraetearchaeota archaeon]RLE51302.1 MAG: aminomethyl-transferring glycine dehydrogenase subunit GcvPA [Candidatus Verstraetearchaeota archaeon]